METAPDNTETQREVAPLLLEKFPNLPPISQGTIIKIEKQFREVANERQMIKVASNALSGDAKLDISLEFEENPHNSVIRTLKENKTHPFKMIPAQEVMEDDFDRRTYSANK